MRDRKRKTINPMMEIAKYRIELPKRLQNLPMMERITNYEAIHQKCGGNVSIAKHR
jgi:hypothetical protein